ncbi:MAG: MFS transporter [Candidatus Aenigmatarchaeota archaeon]
MGKKDSGKVVRVFSLASFLNDLGSDIIYPIWPLFVTEVLGAKMAVLGLIDGLGEALVSISQAISGYLSDKTGKRKIFIWMGYLLAFFSRIGYSFSRTWQHLIPFKVMDRFGKIRGAPRDAIVSEVSNKRNRGKNFGILRMMDNLGAVAGILLSIFLVTVMDYRTIFLLAAIPSLFSVILILFFIKDRNGKVGFKKIIFKGLSRNFKLFLIISSIFSLASFSYSFLLLYAKRAIEVKTFIPVFYLLFTLTAMIVSIPFGKMSDRIGRKKVVTISYMIFGLMCIGFILLRNLAGLMILFILYGLHLGSYIPAQKALVAELSPKESIASGIGVYQMIVGLCALPGSFIAGLLWDNFGMYFPLYFSIGLTLVSVVMLKFLGD